MKKILTLFMMVLAVSFFLSCFEDDAPTTFNISITNSTGEDVIVTSAGSGGENLLADFPDGYPMADGTTFGPVEVDAGTFDVEWTVGLAGPFTAQETLEAGEDYTVTFDDNAGNYTLN